MGCYGIERRETMSNKTQLQANNETLASILSNVLGLPSQESLKHGAYVWKKMTAEGGDFIDYVVSDQENAYPDGGIQDGYWYELFDLKSFGIDFGEVTLASSATSVTVNHNLGVTPSTVAIFPKNLNVSTYGVGKTFANINGIVLKIHNALSGKVENDTANIDLTETNISFGSASKGFEQTTYYWIAIA